MSIPNLKRVKVSTQQEISNWLSKQASDAQSIMLITCDKNSKDKYLSNDQVDEALSEHGWSAGRRYTLNGNLIGHVISNGAQPK